MWWWLHLYKFNKSNAGMICIDMLSLFMRKEKGEKVLDNICHHRAVLHAHRYVCSYCSY